MVVNSSINCSENSSERGSDRSNDSETSSANVSLNLNTLHSAMVFLMLHSGKKQKNLTVPFKYIHAQIKGN